MSLLIGLPRTFLKALSGLLHQEGEVVTLLGYPLLKSSMTGLLRLELAGEDALMTPNGTNSPGVLRVLLRNRGQGLLKPGALLIVIRLPVNGRCQLRSKGLLMTLAGLPKSPVSLLSLVITLTGLASDLVNSGLLRDEGFSLREKGVSLRLKSRNEGILPTGVLPEG